MSEKVNNVNRRRAFAYLNDNTLEKMEMLAAGLVYKRVKVKAELGSNCYTVCNSNPVNVVLGVDFFSDLKTLSVGDIRNGYIGTYMHELGHVVFTDLDSVNKLPDEDRMFVFPFINIHEDYVVERAMGYIYDINHVFKRLTAVRFGYINEAVEEETHQGFLCGFQAIHRHDEATARRNPIIDKNWEFIHDNYFRIADILDSTERFNQQVWFAKELLKILKDEGIDPVKDYNEFMEELSQYLQEALDSMMKSSGSGEQSKQMGQEGSGSGEGGEESDEDGKPTLTAVLKRIKEDVDSAITDKEEMTEDLENNPERPWQQIIAEQDSGVNVTGVHRNSDYHKVESYVDAKVNMSATIRQLEESIKKCGIDYRESIPGQFQGKFNLREAMRPGNLRNFDRVLDHSTDPGNMLFDVVLDVSGSMLGNCAKIAGMCVVALCEALEYTHVDYRLHFYSSDYILVKDVGQKLDKVKPAIEKVLNSARGTWKGLDMWYGNNESLMMRELRENSKNIRKDKVMIHIGDGGFYFSNKNHISNEMEKNGYITTLGVGLMCDEMSKYHKNSITVMNSSEFGKLPRAILDYIASLFR